MIDFKNTVVIMTSNVGAKDITKSRTLGFSNADTRASFEKMSEKVKEELNHTFNPEFLNRLDDVIVFHPLSQEHIAEIVGILLKDVQKRLGDEELTLKLTDAASAFLVKHGYDEKFGARPLKRAIQKFIEDPLSEKILLAEFSKGDEIEVDLAADGEKLEFRVLASSPKGLTGRIDGTRGAERGYTPFRPSFHVILPCYAQTLPRRSRVFLRGRAAPCPGSADRGEVRHAGLHRDLRQQARGQHDDPAGCRDNSRHVVERADGAARHPERLQRRPVRRPDELRVHPDQDHAGQGRPADPRGRAAAARRDRRDRHVGHLGVRR